MNDAKYRKEVARYRERISGSLLERNSSGLSGLIEQIIQELEEIIFNDSERPKWLRIIFNIAKVIARVVTLITAYRAENKIRELKALEEKNRGPKTKDGYLE